MPPSNPHPWLDHAWAGLGTTVSDANQRGSIVQGYFASAGHPEVTSDSVAWCAAFVGACLERSGIKCTRSLLARSYLDFGTPLQTPQAGAIAIFSRGADRSTGHVAFVVGESGSDHLIVLGGNQSHSVSVIVMPRDRLLGLRWPASQSDVSPAPPKTVNSAFDHALAHVLSMEGGYSNDPYDPGGPTNLGITQADLAAYRAIANTPDNAEALKAAIAALTPAGVAPIYRTFYWDRCHADDLPAALAFFHFDTAVNHGLGSAARMLQQALAVDIDGDIGPLTLAAARTVATASILSAYANIRRARYRALPTFWRFGRGWLARADSTETAARALFVSNSSLPSPTPEPVMPDTFPNAITPTAAPASAPTSAATPKWWGQSMTIWGTIVTGLATVLPIAGPFIGIDISADMVHQIGDGVVHAGQALAGVIGILMTVYGRTRAIQPLVRRDFRVKL